MPGRHPLQRLESPGRLSSLAVHGLGLALFLDQFRFLASWPSDVDDHYGWHFQFLTIIGLALSAATFGLAALADLTLSRRLFAAKNWLSVCSAPMEVLISVLYWGLRAVDPLLVVREGHALPLARDLAFHLAPAALTTADLVLLSPPWAVRAYSVVALSSGLAVAYWLWIELCFSRNSVYPYPIFGLLSTPQRILLFSAAASLMTASTFLLKWLYGRVNGIEQMSREAAKPLGKIT